MFFMPNILKTAWKICTFQQPFDKLPNSFSSLISSILLFSFSLYTCLYLLSKNTFVSLYKVLLVFSILALFSFIALQIRNLENRYKQTFTAIFASHGFINFLMIIPYLFLRHVLPNITSSIAYNIGKSLSAVLILSASIWLFLVFTLIYEFSLNIKPNNALVLTITLFGLEALVFSMLFF